MMTASAMSNYAAYIKVVLAEGGHSLLDTKRKQRKVAIFRRFNEMKGAWYDRQLTRCITRISSTLRELCRN